MLAGLLSVVPGTVLAAAPAKVNLFLEVLGKRGDGFHAVETLILLVDLFDTLEVRDDATGKLTLECDAPGVPSGPGNLAYEAARVMQAAFAPARGAAIRLTKRIPHQAGLGGGSSDAALTIAALNELWGLRRSADELAAVAGQLGSDVAAFLAPPASWGTGRGEVVEPESVGRTVDLVVVKPRVGLATAEVYKRVTVPANPVPGDRARAALRAGDVEALAECLHNRLQDPAFTLRPEVGEVARQLSQSGPLGCLMSGSGSSVFALCRDRADAARVARQYRRADPDSHVFVVRSLNPFPR
jgi:4-diphosphocytidyl-2-C-methyl-D-erythritol kinase